MSMKRIGKPAVLGMVAAALVVACGQDPPQSVEPTSGEATPTSQALSGYEAVVAEIEGLGSEERWSRLVELAEEEEEGTLQVYATISGDEIGPLMDGFVEATGSDQIKTTSYRAGTTSVLQRISEEESAGARQVDAVVSTGTALQELSNEGLLQPFETPLAEDLIEDGIHPDWAAIYINLYTAAWNTDLVAESAAPTTWEEVLSYTAGPVGVEVKSYDWFATLVTEYFMEQQGLSEDEAVALFMEADMVPVDGRTALTEFTVAGQFDVAASTYTQNVDKFKAEGAPIDWEPPVEPLLLQPNGVAPVAESDVPATTLLFIDYLLGEEGQEVLVGFERIPTNVNVEGSMTEDYEVVPVDVAEMVDNREKWEGLFAEVTGDPVASP